MNVLRSLYLYPMRKLEKRDYDAVVIGSGPNGLSAAITLQQAGLSVAILEGKDTIGGGLRTKELTLPGFRHDVCSAIHPLAIASPFFQMLPLADHGLQYLFPTFAAAHPLDNGEVVIVDSSVENTSRFLGKDQHSYTRWMNALVSHVDLALGDILGPLSIPSHPIAMSAFGLKALQPANFFSSRYFHDAKSKAMWAGMAAHSMLPLNYPATAAIGLVLLASAHSKGWPIPKGGSQAIATALASYFLSIGGKIELNRHITAMSQLPSSHAVLFDTSPRQMLAIAGHKFSSFYRWQLNRYKYGMGVFKMDWALSTPIPFKSPEARMAGTVHVGGTAAEINISEQSAWRGTHVEKPFVLVAQPSVFDSTRCPDGKHVAWAYCHVPSGSIRDMTSAIENQIERFAPGFRDAIIGRSVMNANDMEQYNP
ncbi:MAG TPA: NAD(P)/FAD-dependent oxidoreductase, partial [Chryseosolibacter sp.]|nr:NAD(P)/FAD-dependent oxidoreductase [Chryseosolibacter sp.]